MNKSGTSVLIVGSGGQDGRVLQDIFHKQGRQVFCSTRIGILNPAGIKISDFESGGYKEFIRNHKIDEVYFLAAEHSPAQIENAESDQSQLQNQLDLISNSLIQLLEAIRIFSPSTRVFFASSALVFGGPSTEPQDESTRMSPNEIYGLFKCVAQQIISYYREAHGIYTLSGILYPHESEYRKENFLFKKIVNAAKASQSKPDQKLVIADTSFMREWNCAYQAMNSAIDLMRLEVPSDFVIGSGVQHSVGDVVKFAYEYFNLDYRDFLEDSAATLIPRSSMLRANPEKLINSIGSAPDGDVRTLLSRTFPRL